MSTGQRHRDDTQQIQKKLLLEHGRSWKDTQCKPTGSNDEVLLWPFLCNLSLHLLVWMWLQAFEGVKEQNIFLQQNMRTNTIHSILQSRDLVEPAIVLSLLYALVKMVYKYFIWHEVHWSHLVVRIVCHLRCNGLRLGGLREGQTQWKLRDLFNRWIVAGEWGHRSKVRPGSQTSNPQSRNIVQNRAEHRSRAERSEGQNRSKSTIHIQDPQSNIQKSLTNNSQYWAKQGPVPKECWEITHCRHAGSRPGREVRHTAAEKGGQQVSGGGLIAGWLEWQRQEQREGREMTI